MEQTPKIWRNAEENRYTSKEYQCAFCGNQVGSGKSFYSEQSIENKPSVYTHIYICPRCASPTYFDEDDKQVPGPTFGEHIEDIEEIKEIINLYNEARRAMSVDSHTAAAMCCRKLLVNMAVKKGAKAGDTFKGYVQYFLDNHYLHEDYKDWIGFIKDKGNDANHEIPEISRGDAEKMITFVGMLIKILYEFNAKMSEASNSSDTV